MTSVKSEDELKQDAVNRMALARVVISRLSVEKIKELTDIITPDGIAGRKESMVNSIYQTPFGAPRDTRRRQTPRHFYEPLKKPKRIVMKNSKLLENLLLPLMSERHSQMQRKPRVKDKHIIDDLRQGVLRTVPTTRFVALLSSPGVFISSDATDNKVDQAWVTGLIMLDPGARLTKTAVHKELRMYVVLGEVSIFVDGTNSAQKVATGYEIHLDEDGTMYQLCNSTEDKCFIYFKSRPGPADENLADNKQ